MEPTMTGYTVHTGASKKFVSGWDRIFSDGSGEAKKKKKSKKAAKAVSKAGSGRKKKKKKNG